MSFRVWLSCAVFAGHAWHVETLVAAACVEYVLFAHSVHATLPLLGLKRPARHGTQPPAWMPPAPGSYPATHVHWKTLSDAASDSAKAGHARQTKASSYALAAHATHDAADVSTVTLVFTPAKPGAHRVQLWLPGNALCVPEAQIWQASEGPVKPGAHWHVPRPTPPRGATACSGHAWHTRPPVVAATNSGAQSSHCAALELALADVWPAAHGRHAELSVAFL
jgi:hypothetical protein